MIYAVNLFDVIPAKEATYRDYSVKAGRIIYGLGGRVLASGCFPETLVADRPRQCFILVEFPSREAFQKFHDTASEQDIHRLRESSTTNYIWELFQPWDLKAWVRGSGSVSAHAEGP
jgi:uncharacterized protein (DUF1330 family)